jgi:hypothetical protein
MQNLDRDSILLMYIAGELSADDQADLESLLLNDPELRARYEELREADEIMIAALSQADATTPLPAPQSSSVWKVASAINDWKIRKLQAQPAPVIRHGRNLAWLYSTGAVAAAIIVTVFILWSRVDDGKSLPDLTKLYPDVTTDNKTDSATDEPKDAVASDEVDPDSAIVSSDSDLTRAESDLFALSTLTDALRTPDDTVTP